MSGFTTQGARTGRLNNILLHAPVQRTSMYLYIPVTYVCCCYPAATLAVAAAAVLLLVAAAAVLHRVPDGVMFVVVYCT